MAEDQFTMGGPTLNPNPDLRAPERISFYHTALSIHNSTMAIPRRQQSLEMVLDFTPTFQLPMNQYDTATVIFQQLIDHYGLESSLAQRRYKPAKLIQALFDNMAAKHSFLRFFFTFIHEYSGQEADVGPDLGRPLSYFHDFLEWSPDRKRDLNETIEAFATYIVDDFLLPRKCGSIRYMFRENPHYSRVSVRASSAKTPQPTPSSLSSIQASTPTGTLGRVSGLRRTCLKRDQHRCVISNSFDLKEADKRYEQEGDNYRDDAGNFLRDEPSENFAFLEVGHILPHCLTTVSTGDADLVCLAKNTGYISLTYP